MKETIVIERVLIVIIMRFLFIQATRSIDFSMSLLKYSTEIHFIISFSSFYYFFIGFNNKLIHISYFQLCKQASHFFF